MFGGFTIANGVTIENASTGSGADRLIGNDAANVLAGNAGDDSLAGGGGADTLIGGLGRDSLEGGAGADLFRFESGGDSAVGSVRDLILDFETGSDRIDLSAVGGSTFIGTSAFTGAAGQVRYAAFAGTTIVELDGDGDRIGDFQIELDGTFQLGADDFTGLAALKTAGGKGHRGDTQTFAAVDESAFASPHGNGEASTSDYQFVQAPLMPNEMLV